jgi:autoinducer 2 (AI-2) kinase
MISFARWAYHDIFFRRVVSSGTALGPLGKDAAAHLGLQPGIPVVTGGGDAQCGLLGAHAVDSGEMGIVAGSTMPMQSVLDRGLIDDEARLWTSHHVVQGPLTA